MLAAIKHYLVEFVVSRICINLLLCWHFIAFYESRHKLHREPSMSAFDWLLLLEGQSSCFRQSVIIMLTFYWILMALPYGRISIVISRNILLAYRKSSLPLLLLFTFWLKLGGDPVLHQFMNKVSISQLWIMALIYGSSFPFS